MEQDISVRSRYVHVTTQSGVQVRLPVRYVQLHGIALESAPTGWQHHEPVAIALAYLQRGQVHLFRTCARVDNNQLRGVSLHLMEDRDTSHLLKALMHATVVEDVFCALGERLIAAAALAQN